MADVDIRVTLQGGEVGHGRRYYEPGSTVRGSAQLVSPQDVECDRVLARIGWHTEGRGSRDHVQVGEAELRRGPLKANTFVTENFDFALPTQPWSYTGHHINIIWEVTITMTFRWTRDIRLTEQIVVTPRRADRPPGQA
jgi:hypothetical protein